MTYRTRIKYTAEQKAEMWDRWQRGESLNSIGRVFDRHSSSIFGRLLPQCDDEVVGRVGLDGEGTRQGPGQAPSAAVVHLDVGPTHLEVVELLGLDPRKRLRIISLPEEVGNGSGGCIASIVPPFPGKDGSRSPKLRARNPVDVVHAPGG